MERRLSASIFSHDFSTFESEDGQALVEYSLVLLLIALVTVGALTTIGTTLSDILNGVAAAF